MPQTSFSVGSMYTGHIISGRECPVIRSYKHNVAEDVEFGIFVVEDTSEGDGCAALPAAQNEYLAGVAVYDPTIGSDVGHYNRYDEMNVMEVGDIVVLVEENVDPSKPVRVQMVAEAGFAAGTVRTTASSGKSVLLNARFLSTALADGKAKLSLNGLAFSIDT